MGFKAIFTDKEAESTKHKSNQLLPPSDTNSSKKNKNKSNKAYEGAKGHKGVISFWIWHLNHRHWKQILLCTRLPKNTQQSGKNKKT